MWVKLDDEFFDNPKVARLSDKGQLLYIASLTYSAKHLTDGCLLERGVRIAKALVNATDKTVKELVEGGLWEPGEGCYAIHDWAKYNPPAAKVRAEREAARKRMFAVRSPERSGEVPPEQTSEVTPVVHPPPVPRTPLSRKPDPVSRSGESADALLADSGFVDELRGRFADVDFDYEVTKWRDHIRTKPPKGNYKNSLRNWLENSVKFGKSTANGAAPADPSFFEDRYRRVKEAT